MSRLATFIGAASWTAAVLFSFSLSAGDGRIPISAAPFIISAPGSYYLTQDLQSAGTAITINSNIGDVTLDLNGHKVSNSSAAVNTITAGPNSNNIRIMNGTVSGGAAAVFISAYGGDIMVERVTCSSAANTCFYLTGASGLGTSRALVTDNRALNGTANGFYLSELRGSRVSGNLVQGGGSNAGIYLYNCVGTGVEDNVVNSAGNRGISLYNGGSGGGGNTVARNTVSGGFIGFDLQTPNNRLLFNLSSGTSGNGFTIGAANNAVDWNHAANSGTAGINFSAGTGNFMSNNRSTNSIGNAAGAVSGGGNCVPAGCS